MTETLTINGVGLDTYAHMLTDMSGIMTVAGRRGANVTVPGRHGVIRTPRKRFEAAELVLPLWINGALPNGSVPGGSTAQREFFARRDQLLRLLYAETLTLEYTRPDGRTVSAVCEVVDVLDFTRSGENPQAQVSVALSLFGAFWQDTASVSHVVSGTSGVSQVLTLFAESTAPMCDLVLTFTGPVSNPQVTAGTRFVKYNGVLSATQQLVINTATWTLGVGSGTAWTPDIRQVEFGPGPTWLEIDTPAASASFTHTGGGSASVTISGRRAYLAP